MVLGHEHRTGWRVRVRERVRREPRVERDVILGAEPSAVRHPRDEEDDGDPDHHVGGVQAGHREVERVEDLRRPGLLALQVQLLGLEALARHQVVVELVLVLHRLDPQEHRAQGHGEEQPGDRRPPPAEGGGVHAHGHGQAAADEHRGVDGAQREVQVAAGLHERVEVQVAVDRVGEEQAAEEHHLRHEEHPHAEGGGLFLRGEALEVMDEVRVMAVRVPSVRVGHARQLGPPPRGRTRRPLRSPPAGARSSR